MTKSYCKEASDSNLSIDFDPSSSDGLGGTGPQGSKSNPCISLFVMDSSNVVPPTSTLLRHFRLSSLNV